MGNGVKAALVLLASVLGLQAFGAGPHRPSDLFVEESSMEAIERHCEEVAARFGGGIDIKTYRNCMELNGIDKPKLKATLRQSFRFTGGMRF